MDTENFAQKVQEHTIKFLNSLDKFGEISSRNTLLNIYLIILQRTFQCTRKEDAIYQAYQEINNLLIYNLAQALKRITKENLDG